MNPLKKLGFGDSYVSLVLGIVVVAIIGVLLVSFIRRQAGLPQPLLPPAEVEKVSQEQLATLPTKHTIAEGEDLWTISEKYYKSGYNWVDIASENELANPDVLAAGTELTIPNVEPKVSAQEPQIGGVAVSIQGDAYTVVTGDNLWDIAVRAYGDGFKWAEISKANNLANPDLIHAGNVLKLPR